MCRGGFNLSGEEFVNIIFLDYNNTGDGMLSAIQLVNVMKETGKPLSELAAEMTVFTQVLKNVKVIDRQKALNNPEILEKIDAVEQEMGDAGRVLVRPSGTEPLVRVMVEAPTEEECEKYADQVVKVIDDLLGMKE